LLFSVQRKGGLLDLPLRAQNKTLQILYTSL